MGAVGADVLFHVILPRKRLVADGTVDALLACVFLAMPCRMPGRCERGRAAVGDGVRTGVLVLSASSGRREVLGPGKRGLWGRRIIRIGYRKAALGRRECRRIGVFLAAIMLVGGHGIAGDVVIGTI